MEEEEEEEDDDEEVRTRTEGGPRGWGYVAIDKGKRRESASDAYEPIETSVAPTRSNIGKSSRYTQMARAMSSWCAMSAPIRAGRLVARSARVSALASAAPRAR